MGYQHKTALCKPDRDLSEDSGSEDEDEECEDDEDDEDVERRGVEGGEDC